MKKEKGLMVKVTFVPLVPAHGGVCVRISTLYLGSPDFYVGVSVLKGLKPESVEANVLKKHKNCPKWAKVWPLTFHFTWEDFWVNGFSR